MHNLRSQLINNIKAKILLIVLDGVGGIPNNVKTELEYAKTPNLDKLAIKSETGCHIPIIHGLTPGSGSAHLSLFGYDPMEFDIGRGVLEALGLDLEIGKNDLAIRGNFATVKEGDNGKLIVTNRRAGRIDTKTNERLTKKLSAQIKKINKYKIIFKSGIDHRFVVKIICPNKIDDTNCFIQDTDPQAEGLEPLLAKNLNSKAKALSGIVVKLISSIEAVLKDEKKANFALFRGYSTFPGVPTFEELYGIKAASITTYPMYKGIGRLVGMSPLKVNVNSIHSQVSALEKNIDKYDFFYLHIKKTDSYGEDGKFKEKVKVIEEFDKVLPKIKKLNFDVLAITGDHSTPSKMKGHSWHPVPVIIKSHNSFEGISKRFTEKECLKGNMGIFEGKYLLNLIFAHGQMLNKFGA